MQVIIDGKHEYDIKKHTRTATLFRSKDSDWTTPGEYIGGVIDDGNGLEFDLPFLSKRIEYYEVDELFALLLAVVESKYELKKTKTVRSV